MRTKTTPFNKRKIEKLVREMIVQLGENPDREGLIGTPQRMANMFEEIFAGCCMRSELGISVSEDTDSIIAQDIRVYSMCEHHMLPFFGRIHIAYTPSGRVLGISQLARLVEKNSKRLQIQERLTKEIADEIMNMGVKGVTVIAEGEHLCMKMRGVRNDRTIITVSNRGLVDQNDARSHLLALIYDSKPKIHTI